VNFMPLNHVGGRLPLVSSFLTGGVSYFVPESDMSTLFEDWALVRPTELGLVPRVVDMLFQRYVSVIDHRIANGAITADAENAAAEEPVIDYKLVDVPELGYFLTDKPYPR